MLYIWTNSPPWTSELASAEKKKNPMPPWCAQCYTPQSYRGMLRLCWQPEEYTYFPRAAASRTDGIFSRSPSLSVLSFLMPHCSFFIPHCQLGSDSTPAEVNGESPTEFIWLWILLSVIFPPSGYDWTQIPALTSQRFGFCLCITSLLTACTFTRVSAKQWWGKLCGTDTSWFSSWKENLWKFFSLDHSETFSLVFPSLKQKENKTLIWI